MAFINGAQCRAALVIFALLSLLSCSEKSKDEGSAEPAILSKEVNSENFIPVGGAGCIQGAVIDGQSGLKLDLTKLKDGLGIFVMIRGRRYLASVVEADGRGALVGEYFICGVPLDEEYLIFADYDGYLPFQSTVRVDSTTRSAQGQDITKTDPLLLANIRLFPLESEVRNLVVNVFHEGQPLLNALVRVDPTPSNVFDKTGFLVPQSARLQSVYEYTDENGKAEFDAAELVLGATYDYTIIPTKDDETRNLFVESGQFTLGALSAGSQAKNSYEFTVDLKTQEQPLRIVSCGPIGTDWNSSGAVSYVFNRSVRLVDRDDPTATMADIPSRGGDGEVNSVTLASDADNNDGISEQVNVAIAGSRIELTPRFEGGSPDSETDRGLQVIYDATSIHLSVTEGENGDNTGPITLQSLIDAVRSTPAIPATDTTPAIAATQGLDCPISVYYFPYLGVPED